MPSIDNMRPLAPAKPELLERPRRRSFTAADKLRIPAEVEGAAGVRGGGAIIQRAGLCSPALPDWQLLRGAAFAGHAPAEVHATLPDRGSYLCLIGTMYHALAAEHEVRERCAQLRRPVYRKPELLAQEPGQVWSRDIANQVHHGEAGQIHAARQNTLDAACRANPECFVRNPQQPPPKPTAAWINPPAKNQPIQV